MSNLTKLQQNLADLLLNTKIRAKVRRRKRTDGNVQFYYVIRDTSPIDFRVVPSEFAFVHHEKYPSAPLSPIIVNLRNLPDSLNERIARCLAKVPLKKKPDFVTGIPNAAIPYAQEFSKATKIPYAAILEKDDQPGRPRILPAKNAPPGGGKTLLLVDDVITKGESKFRAFQVAEGLGYKVIGLMVLVDRGEGGKEVIEQAGYQFYAPFTLKDLFDYYLKKRSITKKQYDEVIDYIRKSQDV